MRGGVGILLKNVGEIIFVHKKRGGNGVERQIVGDVFGYIVDGFGYDGVGFAANGEVARVLQEVLPEKDKQRFDAFLIFDIGAESVVARVRHTVQHVSNFVGNRSVAHQKRAIFRCFFKASIEVGFGRRDALQIALI